MAIRRSAEICPSEIDASPLAPLLNAGWWKPEHGPIFIRVLQRPPLGTSAIFRSRLWHSMFHGISSKYHPLTQPVVGYAVGMFEGDLAPTSTRRATKTAFEQRQRKRAATRAHQRCEKVRHCTPHTLIALRHKGSGSRKTTAPSANEKAAHRPSVGRAR